MKLQEEHYQIIVQISDEKWDIPEESFFVFLCEAHRQETDIDIYLGEGVSDSTELMIKKMLEALFLTKEVEEVHVNAYQIIVMFPAQERDRLNPIVVETVKNYARHLITGISYLRFEDYLAEAETEEQSLEEWADVIE